MIKLTVEETKQALREILLSAPETRFITSEDPDLPGTCIYFNPDGTPSCVIGHLFSRVGITAEDIDQPANTMRVLRLGHIWANRISAAAGNLLMDVQLCQDSGASWGEVYEHIFGEANEAASTETV